MERREALRLLATGAVIPAISPRMVSFFELAQAQIAEGYALRTLNSHQNAIVTVMTDLIIPETETPGAKAARVNEFIDVILTEWATEEERRNFLDGIENVDQRGRALFGKSFVDCDKVQQEEILRELDQTLAVEREELAPRRPRPKTKNKQLQGNVFGVLKRLTVYGYYTSEIGFRQELQEEIIPGVFNGCVPLTQGKKVPGAQKMPNTVYDAIVIGSGMTGGWAAKELTEKGLKTLALEAGRPIVPEQDYVEHIPAWKLKYRGWDNRAEREKTQLVQRECYACEEWAHKLFVNDLENPYTTDPGKPFLWIRGRQVGGKSIMWARQSYRWSDLDFEANLRDGIAVDWPIRYAELAPWYDYVEEFAGISGQAEGLPQLPDGKFLPPMEMNCAETVVRDAMAKKFNDGRMMTIGRAAVLTQTHRGRAACHYCGPCHRGCITRSYFSSVNATLPAAEKTGRMTLRPYSVVHSLIFDAKTRRASGVRVIDGQTKQAMEFRARVIFLCASTLESTRILLNSVTPEFPNGLANSSGELGHNLMDHVMGGGAEGTIPGHEDKVEKGNRPNGIYVPRFRNVKSKEQNFLRGYGYQGSGSREGWERGMRYSGFGVDFKNALRQPGPWHFSLKGFGECLPNRDNFVEIDKNIKDAWGIPALKIHCAFGDNEKALLEDMSIQAAEILAAAGATEIRPFIENNPPGLTIHEMGTARMGRDPKTSVLNGQNQAHDVKNLFVTDGACMVSSACVNPSLTYMALTARACDFAVSQMKKGEL